MTSSIDKSALIDPSTNLGKSCTIWGLVEIREDCVIGNEVSLARGVYLGPGVIIGDGTRIQNNALIYEPTEIHENVFIGPGCIITNDPYPRVFLEPGIRKTSDVWTKERVVIESNANLGAGVICLPGIRVGAFSLIGAGSVVTRSIPSHSLAYGNPARIHARIDESGNKLEKKDKNIFFAPRTGQLYIEDINGNLIKKVPE